MVDPKKVQHNVTLFTMPPNATEVLQRLRDSYSALSEGDVLFNKLNLPKPVKYGKGKTISTAVSILEDLAAEHL